MVLRLVILMLFVTNLSGQLVLNGSMEEGNTGLGVVPDGWYIFDGSPDCCYSDTLTCEDITYKIPICSPDSGKWVRFFYGEIGGEPYSEVFGRWLSEPLFEGKEYTLSYYGAYSPVNSSNPPTTASSIVVSFGNYEGVIYSDTFFMHEENQWEKYTVTFVAPGASGKIEFRKLTQNYKTACYVDGVTLDCVERDTVSFYHDTVICASHPFLFPLGIPNLMNCDIMWNTGNTSYVQELDTIGIYWIQTETPCRRRVDTFNVHFYESAISCILPGDTLLCDGDSLLLDVTSEVTPVEYLWGDSTTSPQFLVTDPGFYHVSVIDSVCSSTDIIKIEYFDEVMFSSDSILCVDLPEVLEVDNHISTSYLWSNGSDTTSIYAENYGTFWVETTNHCGIFRDSIFLKARPELSLGNDTTICEGDTLVLDVSGFTDFRWYLQRYGEYFYYDLPVYYVTGSETISVDVWSDCPGYNQSYDWIHVDVESCDDRCSVYVPNAFSPNNDAVNDSFVPKFPCVPESYQISIFNRWGNKVFESSDYSEEWTGRLRGQQLPVGVYVYILTYRTEGELERTTTGDITLLK